MVTCKNCKKLMTCLKNGIKVLNKEKEFTGDMFYCKACDNYTALTF